MRLAIIGMAMTGLLAGCGSGGQEMANGAVAFDTTNARAAVGKGGKSEMTAIDASVGDASGMPVDSGYIRAPVPEGANNQAEAKKPAKTVVADEAVTDDDAPSATTAPVAAPPAAS